MSSKAVNSEQLTVNSQKRNAFSILEIILAMGLFAVIISGAVGVVIQAFSSTRLGEEVTKATFLANEGLEAVRAIQERDFWSLVTGTYGLDEATGIWKFSDTPDTSGKYTRKIVIYNVYRDENGDIVPESEGTTFLDLYTKRVESVVTWNFAPGRANSVSLKTYFTNLQEVENLGGDLGCRGVSGDWTDPVTLASVDLGAGNQATGLDVKQKIVYMSAQASAEAKPDFFIVDATSEQNPFIRSSLHTGPGLNAIDVANNYAYVGNNATNAQLQIINVTNLNNPVPASSFQLLNVSGDGAVGQSVFFYASRVYIGTKEAAGPEFHIVDVSNPGNPVELGSKEVNADVNAIYVIGTTAYLATSDVQELKIFDVSKPATITQIGGFGAPGNSEDGKSLSVVGNKLYLGRTLGEKHTDHHELHILDISNPTLEVVDLGSKDLAADLSGIAVCENLAFLSTSDPNTEFQAWNVADPKNIIPWSSLNFPQSGVSLDFEDNFVYVAVRSNDALRIITSQ